jgi:CheY-like chemotaxis protein
MVNLHALIVDDNPAVREALEDRVESMGHTFDSAGCQDDALLRLKERGFDYILLDLELPTKFGKTPLIPVGKNLLVQLRTMALHRNTPVIVVTAHGHDGPDLAVDVMKLGADDFVKKPFEDLERRIMDALSRRLPSTDRRRVETNDTKPLAPFESGDFIVTAQAVELCGVRVCESESGRTWQIINLLAVRTDKGTLPAFSGKAVADELKIERGEKGVNEAIKHFRDRCAALLAERAGLACNGNDVIVTTNRGYQLSPKLNVQVVAPSKRKLNSGSTPAKCDATQRKEWVLAQLAKKKRLKRRDYEKQFGVSSITAKRDLGSLGDRIEFTGVGEDGFYRLKQLHS